MKPPILLSKNNLRILHGETYRRALAGRWDYILRDSFPEDESSNRTIFPSKRYGGHKDDEEIFGISFALVPKLGVDGAVMAWPLDFVTVSERLIVELETNHTKDHSLLIHIPAAPLNPEWGTAVKVPIFLKSDFSIKLTQSNPPVNKIDLAEKFDRVQKSLYRLAYQ
jgi:hypothetical protein